MNLQTDPSQGDSSDGAPLSEADSDSVVVRFAGDSGDGVQLLGGQFSQATALGNNSLATFPDFPAEIRTPVGTTFGVCVPNQGIGFRFQNFVYECIPVGFARSAG